jgi:hypothetical protein
VQRRIEAGLSLEDISEDIAVNAFVSGLPQRSVASDEPELDAVGIVSFENDEDFIAAVLRTFTDAKLQTVLDRDQIAGCGHHAELSAAQLGQYSCRDFHIVRH